jgi:D-3-phosphoglycerate dehydrogenase
MQSDDFQSLVTVEVTNGDDQLAVSGTQFTGGEPRIVKIDGYRVDAVPHGKMLVARNADKPGVIGFIGSVLGEHEINIAGMFNARRNVKGSEALTIYNLDDPVPTDVAERILADERMIDIQYLTLNSISDAEQSE